MYEQLSKIFYKEPEKYDFEYSRRISSYGTVRLPITIKPFKSNEEFSCFYVNHSELDFLHDLILKQSKLIQEKINSLPDIAIAQYIKAKLIDELLSTNEIEGVRSTKAEMKTVIEIVVSKDAPKKKVRHLSLMKTYFSLFNERNVVIKNIEDIREIYNELVKEEIKKEEELDGVLFRKEAVDVITSTEKVVHRGVYPEKAIQTHLSNFIDYLNEHPSPMLYKIAIAHYYFGYIHPFYDGNGRTSRYISSMYLMDELDKLTAMSLSYSTNKMKQLYYESFSECNDPKNKGELTYFCKVFFEIINNAQNDILADLSYKSQRLEQVYHLIENLDLLSDIAKTIAFITGQHYIFGIEGTGISKSELTRVLDKTDYVISKEIKDLYNKGYIQYTKKNPIEITLSEQLQEKLTTVD
ncbi:hypothetical protein CHH83_05995 [Bacillus sp. 7586-K]|nr:hypothetical protein CHH83_05995 [Bacillus sp. 7586-K]